MGKISTKENKNIYQLAREELGYSRFEAANKIVKIDDGRFGYLDDNRLVKIENETVKIQPDDIVALSKAYNQPELRNYYCCHQCPIGALDTPEVIYKNGIHEILVNMVVTLDNIAKNKGRLMEILADGKVEENEKNDFDKIQDELEKISMTVEALQLWCEKNKSK